MAVMAILFGHRSSTDSHSMWGCSGRSMRLSKFQEVCKVSSKFDMSRKFGVASLQVWPRMVSDW
jgi:hypothetical protein